MSISSKRVDKKVYGRNKNKLEIEFVMVTN